MPDRRLLVLLAGNFMVGINLHIVAGLLDEIAASLQVSVARAGFLIAAFGVTSFFGAPLFATLGSRIDRRLLLTAVLVVGALANLLGALSTGYDSLLLSRVLAAVASCVFTPQAAATVGLLVGESRRGQALSLIMLGWSLASVLGLPLGVLIGSHYGWRVALAVIAAGSLAAAAAVFLSLPRGLLVAPLGRAAWGKVLRARPLLLLIATSLAFFAGNQLVFSYLAASAKQLHAMDSRTLSLLFLVHGLASVCSNLAALLLVNRVGAGRLALCWVACSFAAFALWPLAAGWMLLAFVLQFVWSLGHTAFSATQQARLAAAAPLLAPASIAMNSSVYYLGQAAGTSAGAAAWSLAGPQYLGWFALAPVALAWYLSRAADRAVGRAAEPAA